MHKGHSLFKQSYTLDNIKKLLDRVQPDIVFLQELHGYHPESYSGTTSPLEILADKNWPHFKHGINSIYPSNFHGNAIMSRFPILQSDNTDISTNFIEKRGLLHARIEIQNKLCVDLFCTHLNLSPVGHYLQIKKIAKLIRSKSVSPYSILAGDFNDWNFLAHKHLTKNNQFNSIKLHKTFPSFLPALALDRFYYKGFDLINSYVSLDFKHCSDHLPIIVEFNDF
jgi:endonuclease/exonuclease/phosphatase family metal-dependent hydrolase